MNGTPVVTPRSDIVENAIYEYENSRYIGVSETHIAGIHNSVSDAIAAPTEGLRMISMVGSDNAAKYLREARDALAASLNQTKRLQVQAEQTNQWHQNRYKELGEALLEKAEENDWCAEYDKFAEEWELPTRSSTFNITITLQVEARDDEAANDIVERAMNFSPYDDAVITGPDVDIQQVDD